MRTITRAMEVVKYLKKNYYFKEAEDLLEQIMEDLEEETWE